MEVLKRNENRRKDSITTLLKLLFICSIFLFVSLSKATIIGEGFFIVDEVHSSLLNEGESGYVLCEQDGLLYLAVEYYNQTFHFFRQSVRIINIQQPESPIVVGNYELELAEWLIDFKISENIAYMLTTFGISSPFRFSIELLNITAPTNPNRLGSSDLVYISMYGVNWSERISVYKNYTSVSSLDELEIFDCSNQTLPVRVKRFPSTGGNLYVKNDFLYLVWNGVKIYSIIDPVNPTFRGEVKSTKHGTTGSGIYGNYVINAFEDSGIQVYDCTDPTQPTICEDYNFPKWQLYIEGDIQDMEIVGDRVFTGGRELYIFDISKPQNLKRIARITIGDQNISRITVANNYLYLTTTDNIRIYSYVENSLGRNFGLGLGLGLPVVVASILILRKKRSS